MVTISAATFAFLRDQYAYHVQEFLDDPDGMCMPDTKQFKPGQPGWEEAKIREIAHYQELVLIGRDCQMAFWDVARQEGTPYEIDLLVSYLHEGGVNLPE